MSQRLGDKIKFLRKELNMTQTELAGKEMTKSMLSQIENNSAMPSMKNLQYLAARLGKPVSYFIDSDREQKNQFYEEIQDKLRIASDMEAKGRAQEAISILEAIENNYRMDKSSKQYADFLSKYGECLMDLNNVREGKEKLQLAVEIFKDNYLFIEAAKSYQLLIGEPWSKFDYETCLQIIDESQDIYEKSIGKDYSFEIESLYLKSILHAGLDQVEESIGAINRALDISKDTGIYYRSDELYKNLAVSGLFMNELENFNKHIEKALLFATFTDNKKVEASVESIIALKYNQQGEHEKALEHLKIALGLYERTIPFTYSQMVEAYYGLGRYEEALDAIQYINVPDYALFKYDYLYFWKYKVYEGLCLNKLGRYEEALQAVEEGIKKLEVVGISKTLAEAYRALSEIYSEAKDFEKAFSLLKQANVINETAIRNKLYY